MAASQRSKVAAPSLRGLISCRPKTPRVARSRMAPRDSRRGDGGRRPQTTEAWTPRRPRARSGSCHVARHFGLAVLSRALVLSRGGAKLRHSSSATAHSGSGRMHVYQATRQRPTWPSQRTGPRRASRHSGLRCFRKKTPTTRSKRAAAESPQDPSANGVAWVGFPEGWLWRVFR